ncbi:DUF2752 domain-containing protein [Chitinophaga qingshengii]|uniref:DUF2752 domain-containing protein n=1 Tax=Chitinophaga qingshengii TaxID=1569794 RepID=A0ABR7TQ73_9BACT|nr:DUF2752 domain-containing protein [Chitinophaga qingshengii]MBC9931574.1 DUF2752 domain-containing protein [Chitinophaga qingshengii]
MIFAFFRKVNLELLAWPAGLLCLFLLDPAAGQSSLCLFKQAGIPFCPGCGLGHGIHFLLHGHWQEAIQHHWLSPVAVLILMYRIIQLARLELKL